jgi:hypothetical protein
MSAVKMKKFMPSYHDRRIIEEAIPRLFKEGLSENAISQELHKAGIRRSDGAEVGRVYVRRWIWQFGKEFGIAPVSRQKGAQLALVTPTAPPARITDRGELTSLILASDLPADKQQKIMRIIWE